MKSLKQVGLSIVRGFLFCAMALQIILGIAYIGKNFMAVPQFRDAAVYLKEVGQIPIYCLQIMAGICCVYYVARIWTKRKSVAFICALWLNTIPFVAQAHMTMLAHSFAMTCLLFMSAQVLKGSIRRRALTVLEWAGLLCGFVVLAQLDRAYLLPGMLFAIWAVCLQLYHASNKLLLFGVSLFITIGMLIVNLAIYHMVQTPGHYERSGHTVSAQFFQRAGVVTLKDKYRIYMPKEVQECFSGEELDYISRYPYRIENEFCLTLEKRFGQARADEIYVELGRLGLTTATKENFLMFAKDVLHYAVPLGGYFFWQDGELKGATSWNYQQFMKEAPLLSVQYAKICHLLWAVLLVISLSALLINGIKNKKWGVRIWLPAICSILLYAACFAMRGTDVYDYKMALFPMIMSYAPICIWAFQYIFKEV